MTPGTRVRHTLSEKTGRLEWTSPFGAASVAWDDPLASGDRLVRRADLEAVEAWPDNPLEGGTPPNTPHRSA